MDYNKLLKSPPSRPFYILPPQLRRSYNTTCEKCDLRSTCGYSIKLCVMCVRPHDNDWDAYKTWDERWPRGNDWFQDRIKVKSYWFKSRRIFRKTNLPTCIQALIMEYVTDGIGNNSHIERCIIQKKIPKITNNSATNIAQIPSRVVQRMRMKKLYYRWQNIIYKRTEYKENITKIISSKLSNKCISIILGMLFENRTNEIDDISDDEEIPDYLYREPINYYV
jgi:hypothetical protein